MEIGHRRIASYGTQKVQQNDYFLQVVNLHCNLSLHCSYQFPFFNLYQETISPLLHLKEMEKKKIQFLMFLKDNEDKYWDELIRPLCVECTDKGWEPGN